MPRHACSFVKCRFGFPLHRIDHLVWIAGPESVMKWLALDRCWFIYYVAMFCHFLLANTCKGKLMTMNRCRWNGALTGAPGKPLSPGKPRRPGGPSLPGDPCGPGSPYTGNNMCLIGLTIIQNVALIFVYNYKCVIWNFPVPYSFFALRLL